MSLKPGFFPHHTEECDIQLRHSSGFDKGWYSSNVPQRTYWCNTHNQWCTERPVKVTWEFADGTQVVKERPKDVD